MGQGFTLFTDSQAAMKGMTNDASGPGQEIAIRAIGLAQGLVDQGNTITLRWTRPTEEWTETNRRTSERERQLPSPPQGTSPADTASPF